MATVQSIQQSLSEPYTGILTMSINTAMQGLILNAELKGSAIITLAGANLAALNDASSRKRYVLNGQKAKIDSFTGSYKIEAAQTATYLDNGPYPALTLATNTLTLAYNVPTATTHDHADNATIHIKGAFVVTSASGFVRDGAPNAALDTEVKIKFDNATFTYPATVLDFNMATASFRGVELPVTATTTYGSSAGFTAKHYGIVVFAATNGELCTIRNGVQLDAYSLEIKAGARLRVNSNTANPAVIKTQTEPKIAGVWSFESLSSHTFSSPRNNPVTSVANGGTGLTDVPPNNLLMGSATSGMSALTKITPGVNGQVLTLTGGVPGWAASGGGGGSGTVTSVATTAPITGGTITTTGTIGISAATTSAAGSMSGADKTKLDTVETNADVTDATNVTAAGALMDSEVTNLAQVKAFDESDYATAAQGSKADSAQQPPSEGAFVNGDKTKLDGIEANADVTDTANVVASLTAGTNITIAANGTIAASGGGTTLQHLRLFMKNKSGNPATYSVGSSYVIMDIANTTNWGESTTGTHNDITVTNASSDHIVLGAGGLYHIIVTIEFFPASSTNRDMWLVVSTDTSSTGQLGTARAQNGLANFKMQHTVYHEVASGGSDDEIYFSVRSNGNNSNLIAFSDNRSTITITRVGDSTV